LRNEIVKTLPKKKEKTMGSKESPLEMRLQNTKEEGKKMIIWSSGLNCALVRNFTWN
jgi:hypothetical protein